MGTPTHITNYCFTAGSRERTPQIAPETLEQIESALIPGKDIRILDKIGQGTCVHKVVVIYIQSGIATYVGYIIHELIRNVFV